MNQEIEIPEGHEAKIVENKVVIESKENDNERIRRELIEFLRCSLYVQDSDLEYKKIEEWVTWLEKQKENHWVPSDEQRRALGMVLKYSDSNDESTKVLESLLNDLTKIANPKVAKWKEKQEEQKLSSTEEMELNSLAFLVQLGYICIPPGGKPEPTEWSEEDKENIEVIATHLDNLCNTAMAEILRNLCPQSK